MLVMLKRWWHVLSRTRDRLLAVAGFFVLAAAGTIFWLHAISNGVVMGLLAVLLVYLAISKFERPMKWYQRLAVTLEIVVLGIMCVILVGAVILYVGQFAK